MVYVLRWGVRRQPRPQNWGRTPSLWSTFANASSRNRYVSIHGIVGIIQGVVGTLTVKTEIASINSIVGMLIVKVGSIVIQGIVGMLNVKV